MACLVQSHQQRWYRTAVGTMKDAHGVMTIFIVTCPICGITWKEIK